MNEMKKRVYSYHEALHENKQETTPALSNTDSCKPQKNVSVQDSYKPQKDIPVQDSYKPQKNIPVQNSYKPQRNVQAQGSQIAEAPNYTAKQVPAKSHSSSISLKKNFWSHRQKRNIRLSARSLIPTGW